MMSNNNKEVEFLKWALPRLGYRWQGFRKPHAQVAKRIRERMKHLNLRGGYSEYKQYLETNPAEWSTLDSLCNVTISRFFRDRELWDFLKANLLKQLLNTPQTEPLQIWSAGCCNGEEPYSISMVYEMLAKEEKVSRDVLIVATDRNQDVLKRAMKGEYPGGTLRELTDEEVRTFFTKISDEDEDYRVHDRVKRNTEFEQRDIRHSMPEKSFDIVFCRNLVFTYFDKKEQQSFLDRLYPILNENGYLVIGRGEKISAPNWLKPLRTKVLIYQKIAIN